MLVSDGVDADLVTALKEAVAAEGAMVELVAPMVGGVKASDGTWIAGDEKINGGAVGALRRRRGAAVAERSGIAGEGGDRPRFRHRRLRPREVHRLQRRRDAAVREGRRAPEIDGGFVALKGAGDAKTFVQACRKLRFWEREAKVKQV